MYRRNPRARRPCAHIYADRLIGEGLVSKDEVDANEAATFRAELDAEFGAGGGLQTQFKADWLDGKWSGIGFAEEGARRGTTGVELERLRQIGSSLTMVPEHFNVHRTIQRFLHRTTPGK